MTSTTPEETGQPAGTATPSAAAESAPENLGVATVDAESETNSTDRPGDIPFDQAAAEHENPALA